MPGKLYLIPSLLGEETADRVIPQYNREITARIRFFIVEEIRSARRFIKKICPEVNISDIDFMIYNEHSVKEDPAGFLVNLMNGNDTGLISEAGLPCIADPGSLIVKAAHEKGIRVVPLSGPSSLMIALMASGFNGQKFSFQGYLPVDKNMRAKKLREMEHEILSTGETQIFIEAPYRNIAVFEAILTYCNENLMLCIATDLTLPSESIIVKSIKAWKRTKPDINKKPSVFLLSSEM